METTLHERYICKICLHPCQHAYLSGCCGHNFCKSCLRGNAQSEAKRYSTTCPFCHNEEFTTLPNKQADREIMSLHVMCTNKEKGCEWQGELNNINNHLGNSDGCQFEDVKCSNECGKMLQRRYLTSHVETECPCRKVDCLYCHITGERQFIEGVHKEQCPKLPLPCPNKCQVGSVPRNNIEAHRKECPLETMHCANQCGKSVQRRYFTSHVETKCPRRKVDCQYCHITGEHQFIEGEHKKQCSRLPIFCPNKCRGKKIAREDMEAHRKECPLEMVQCEYHNVGCEERMMRKRRKDHEEEKMEDHLLMTKLKLAENEGRLIKTEDKLASNESKLAFTETRLRNVEVMLHHLISSTEPSNMLIDWPIHLTTMAKKITGVIKICPVVVKISNFRERLKQEFCWQGEPFLSHNKGYKFSLNVFPAGVSDGKGTHLSVLLFLMKGPHDDDLTWPLRGLYEFKLLNQISDCEHHSHLLFYGVRTPDNSAGRVTVGSRAAFGYGSVKFISNKDLHKVTPTCQYLKDDCIFLQISKL